MIRVYLTIVQPQNPRKKKKFTTTQTRYIFTNYLFYKSNKQLQKICLYIKLKTTLNCRFIKRNMKSITILNLAIYSSFAITTNIKIMIK